MATRTSIIDNSYDQDNDVTKGQYYNNYANINVTVVAVMM